MFKFPDHQVGGHQAVSGQLGPLIDDSGQFYKPLQSGDRGERELWFYESFHVNKLVPNHILKFIPKFHGTRVIDASDGSGPHPHLVLEDVVSNYANPCIVDVKIGSRTWYPGATERYVKKCVKKDAETTSLSLGFRISGLKVYDGEDLGYWVPHKREVLRFDVDNVRFALRRFVSSGDENDCAFAGRVYGGESGVLRLLEELKVWFEEQTLYQFNSCSVLICYDKDLMMRGLDPCVKVKLIDFAHVYEGEGIIDHNFVGGLCSLMKFVSDVMSDVVPVMTANNGLLDADR